MSEFSEKCREILLATGTNVYQLSQMSGLDRTSLQRMITGKRLPRLSFVREFCSYLRIDSDEKKELLELYEAERIGKAAFENRKYAEKFLRDLDEGNLLPPFPSQLSRESLKAINSFLGDCFSQEFFSEIFTNLPGFQDFFYQKLLHMKEAFKKELPVYHLLDFYPNPEHFPEGRKNMETISGILFPFLNGYMDYHPRCFYNKTSTLSSHLLFPYYLGSRNSLLLFTGDFSSFLQIRTSSVCKACYEEFFHIWESASAFILPAWEDGEDPSLYTSAPVSCGLNYFPLDLKHSFSSPAKPLYLFSPESLAEILRASQDSAAAAEFFTKKGSLFLLKEEMLPIKNVCIKIFSDYSLSITLPLKESKKLSVYLKESGTGFAFLDYFTALSQGDAVYTDLRQSRILDWLLKSLHNTAGFPPA